MKNTFVIGAVLLIVGLGAGYFIGISKTQNSAMHQMPGEPAMKSGSMNMADSMEGMSAELRGKKGDALDQAFIDQMVKHHEGAIEMAKILLEGTARPELIQLGNDIITAQTREIEMMKQWRSKWFGR